MEQEKITLTNKEAAKIIRTILNNRATFRMGMDYGERPKLALEIDAAFEKAVEALESTPDKEVIIRTGKDLLDSGITEFEVSNGAWIGEVEIRNNQPHLYCYDFGGNLVNSFTIHNNTTLDYAIKPLHYKRKNKEKINESRI